MNERFIINKIEELINPYTNENVLLDVKKLLIEGEKVIIEYVALGDNNELNQKFDRELIKLLKIDLGFLYVTKAIVEPATNVIPSGAKIIAIISGKGGVGKSNVTFQLAKALAKTGKKVAIMDADIYGYSIPKITNLYDVPVVIDNMIQPLKTKEGIEVISSQYFIENNENKPLVWRGPILNKMMNNFFNNVEFDKELEYLLIDMPPGTGDMMLNLELYVKGIESIMVTTPSLDASHVAIRSGVLAQELKIGIIGVIENMSYYEIDGVKHHIFGQGGGQEVADMLDTKIIGEIPICDDPSEVYDKIIQEVFC